jgi:hypothetical protein
MQVVIALKAAFFFVADTLEAIAYFKFKVLYLTATSLLSHKGNESVHLTDLSSVSMYPLL